MSPQPAPRFDPAQVRDYYDRHTASFVSHGQGGGAIHRAVWGPGVSHRDQAFHYVEDRIAEVAQSLIAPAGHALHIVDLGCGVAGSACYLAERLPVRVTGITLSPVQARIAQARIREAGLSDRVACLVGDYNDLPPEVGTADLAYAMESFVHGPAPDRFFAQCRRLLRPGGVLVICDDFRRPTADPRAALAIERFCRGWHVNTLLDREALQELASKHGLVNDSTVDLSAYLELGRPRDRALKALLPLLQLLPLAAGRFDYLSGGSALQECLTQGWIAYEMATFRAARQP
ncbi:MAG: class I SAM-dependent methyltransferase [Acidobacteriota bacterium]|nr:class I SAM-dependent methyltransferase [Acidobacteriota bacterium]